MSVDNVFTSQKETKWVNKQRTLLVSSRNISARIKQLMLDLHELLPNTKKEQKLEKGDIPSQIKDLCMMHSCRSFIYFETHRKHDLYVWIGRFPNGPSIKYHVQNFHNSQDLKMMGNCIKGSRPVLSFDASFNESEFMTLQKELFIHAFNVPKHHPKSMPCCDRVFSWVKESETSNNIWLRQYQIQYEKAGKEVVKNQLIEIGPRMILEPTVILDGCMQGTQLFKNAEFVTPHKQNLLKRLEVRKEKDIELKKNRKKEKLMSKLNVEVDEIDNIFEGDFVTEDSNQEESNIKIDGFEEVN